VPSGAVGLAFVLWVVFLFMAKDKKSVLLYCDIIHTVEELDDIDAGLLFKHYLRYINDQNPDPPSKLIKIVFEPIKQNLKRDLKKWEEKSNKNSESARTRWDKNNANACERTERNAKHADKVTVKDNVKEINKAHLKELSVFISVAYKKKYNRNDGGEIGQDIDYMSERLLQNMTKDQAMDQIRSHKLYTGMQNLTLPSKIETIQAALLETDWVQKMKEKDTETTQSQITNEQARNKHRNGSGITETIAPAYNGRIDTE